MVFLDEKIINQMVIMLNYQQALNDVFDPKWRDNRHAYLRAVVVEGAEAIDHHGYKWWKLQNKDIPQVQLEVVDILHFYLSEVARLNLDDPESALIRSWLDDSVTVDFDGSIYVLSDMVLLDKLELIVGLAVSRRISWPLFRSIASDAGLSFSDLHHQYAAKNVLNLLRQRHGDKEGLYIKVWDGDEDNVHLSRFMESWKADETMDDLYVTLESAYEAFLIRHFKSIPAL